MGQARIMARFVASALSRRRASRSAWAGTIENAPIQRLNARVGCEEAIAVVLQNNDADCRFGSFDYEGWCCSHFVLHVPPLMSAFKS